MLPHPQHRLHIGIMLMNNIHFMRVSISLQVYSWGGRDLVAGRSGNLKRPGKVDTGALASGDKIILVAAGEVGGTQGVCLTR
jgi:hypothetical protein